MAEYVPISIQDLANKNFNTMQDLSISGDPASLQESLQNGDTYLGSTFGNETAPSDSESGLKMDLTQQILTEFNPAFVLVRPEMYHAYHKFLQYLQGEGFQVAYQDKRIITPEMYKTIYEHIFAQGATSDRFPAWATRSIVYTNSPSRLIVFTDPLNRYGATTLPTGFVDAYKGSAGAQDPRKIRGDLVLNEACERGFNTLTDPVIAMALDPFVACRLLVQQPGSHSHLPSEHAMLRYVAEGIHAPNNEEIPKDLSSINTLPQLQDIYYSLSQSR